LYSGDGRGIISSERALNIDIKLENRELNNYATLIVELSYDISPCLNSRISAQFCSYSFFGVTRSQPCSRAFLTRVILVAIEFQSRVLIEYDVLEGQAGALSEHRSHS
jgi:hypothetical protein